MIGLLKQLGMKRKKEEPESTELPEKKTRNNPFDLLELCDAAAQITKMLLGLGAENNWEDVQESKGRSMEAGKYRANWLYLSRHDHSLFEVSPDKEDKTDWLQTFKSGVPQTFFYYTPKTEYRIHKGYVERNAAAAVLSLTGSCDQHAYVLATLLRAILPPGTEINICGLKMKGGLVPHTFVVVGSLGAKNNIALKHLPLHTLLAVDAWPTIGGAVPLKNYFVCSDETDQGVLIIDKRYVADGKDHLIKRVRKQKILLDIINEENPDIKVKSSKGLPSLIHHELEEQVNYTKIIKQDSSLSNYSDYDDMFNVPIVSQQYRQPFKIKEVFEYICTTYPHPEFNRCLEYVQEQVQKITDEEINEECQHDLTSSICQ